MLKSKSVVKYPVVKAYSPGPAILKTRPDLYRSWLIPECEFCGDLHVHGAGAGRREEHCARGPEWFVADFERPYGYTLKLAGECDDPTVFDRADEKRRAKREAYYGHLDEWAKAFRKSIVLPPLARPLQSSAPS